MAVIILIAILFVKHYQIFIRYNFNAAATETNCPAWAHRSMQLFLSDFYQNTVSDKGLIKC